MAMKTDQRSWNAKSWRRPRRPRIRVPHSSRWRCQRIEVRLLMCVFLEGIKYLLQTRPACITHLGPRGPKKMSKWGHLGGTFPPLHGPAKSTHEAAIKELKSETIEMMLKKYTQRRVADRSLRLFEWRPTLWGVAKTNKLGATEGKRWNYAQERAFLAWDWDWGWARAWATFQLPLWAAI